MDLKKQKLAALINGINYRTDILGKCITSFRIGGPLAFLAEPSSSEELITLLSAAAEVDYPIYVIGNGTNLLISDEGADALFIKLGAAMSRCTFDGNFLNAEAGALLAVVAKESVKKGLAGLEWAAGIPGSVGGGAAMNAGAYGGEMKDVVRAVAYIKEGKLALRQTEEADFGYRRSVFSFPNGIVTSVKMQLRPDDGNTKARMEDFNNRRRMKQPLEYASAGSVFKRPEGFFAGALIEGAGLKGLRAGGAEVSEKHAGFIINRGDASFNDVYSLMNTVIEKVYAKFGVLLEPEVRVIK